MSTVLPPPSGDHLKRAAHALLDARRPRLIRAARRALLLRLLDHGTATTDDVRAAVTVPAGVNPTVFGAVPGLLALAGIIRRVDYARTSRALGHSRPVAVWALTDAAAARAWLAAHPDLPEPAERGGDE